MSKGQVLDNLSQPQVAAPIYTLLGAISLTDLDLVLKIVAVIGALVLLAANALNVRNKWLEGKRLKLEIAEAERNVG